MQNQTVVVLQPLDLMRRQKGVSFYFGGSHTSGQQSFFDGEVFSGRLDPHNVARSNDIPETIYVLQQSFIRNDTGRGLPL
jgi:hypothetical protein